MYKRQVLNGANLTPRGVKAWVQLPIVLGYQIASRLKSPKARTNAEMLGLMVHEPQHLRVGPVSYTHLVSSIVQQGEEIWYVLGENFSPYCQVTIEGRRLDAEYITPRLIRLTEDPETDNPGDLQIQVVDKHNEILSDTE